jgi:hypothetical protein
MQKHQSEIDKELCAEVNSDVKARLGGDVWVGYRLGGGGGGGEGAVLVELKRLLCEARLFGLIERKPSSEEGTVRVWST